MASTPIMDRLVHAATCTDLVADTAAGRKVVYAVLAELVQAADELDEDRGEPVTGRMVDRHPMLSELVDLFAGGGQFVEQPERAKIGAGLVRVLERLVGEPRAVNLTILGKSGWQETAVAALLEETQRQLDEERTGAQHLEAAEGLRVFSLDSLRDALRAILVDRFRFGGQVQATREEEQAAVDRLARAISQLAKEHADDAYVTHVRLSHGGRA